MKLIVFVLFVVGCFGEWTENWNIEDLCGEWTPMENVNNTKCGPGQMCVDDSTTFIKSESFEFYRSGEYIRKWRMATGSCPFPDSSGVVIMVINTIGSYSLEGLNDQVEGNFSKIRYDPSRFFIALLKDNKDIYYTTADPGPCMSPLVLWNDPVQGCPCNGTWEMDGSWNDTTGRFDGGRIVDKAQCPNVTNTTNSSCPNTFFLDDRVLYGNARYAPANSQDIAYLELTTWDEDPDVGYANTEVNFKFEAINATCEQALTTSTSAPDGQDGSGNYGSWFSFLLIVLLLVLSNDISG